MASGTRMTSPAPITASGVGADTLICRELGCLEYSAVHTAMRRFVDGRTAHTLDQCWRVEHTPVYTLGQAGRRQHIHNPGDIPIEQSDRGGQVTYHGPGQLVGYPILDLKPDRKDLHRYLRDLEGMLILAAESLGIRAERREGLTGVWVPRGKLAAIGVRVSSGWITSHGFALNVSNDLRYFDTIVPCGIADEAVTSIAAVLGRDVAMVEVENAVVDAFTAVFGRRASEVGVPT